MIPFMGPLSEGRDLWIPMLCVIFLLLGLFTGLSSCSDWLYNVGDWLDEREEQKKEKEEQRKKEQKEKERELTYLKDFDYKKLAEEKAYLNDFDGPQDIEKFLVMLKRNHPQLNWVEAVYVIYLTGRYHEEIYKN